jgi:hypothetical protein
MNVALYARVSGAKPISHEAPRHCSTTERKDSQDPVLRREIPDEDGEPEQ